MSLKAKLEAVIYAAEEPVTLAQLVGLFAEEALEWKAEREAAAAAQAEELAADGGCGFAGAERGVSLSGTRAGWPRVKRRLRMCETGAEADEMPSAGAGRLHEQPAEEAGGCRTEQRQKRPRRATMPRRSARCGCASASARIAVEQLLDELIAEYAADERGIEIREVAGGYRMATKPECHDAVRGFVKRLKPPLKLTLPALETLAVVAYKQPVTAPEVNEIRGVDSSGVFGSLLARKLIVTAGRKQVIGRPILYKTTREFLLRFGLKDVTELPSMEEFEKMAASELDEAALEAGDDTAQEAAAEFNADMSAELEEAADEEPAETKENTPEAAPSGNE